MCCYHIEVRNTNAISFCKMQWHFKKFLILTDTLIYTTTFFSDLSGLWAYEATYCKKA